MAHSVSIEAKTLFGKTAYIAEALKRGAEQAAKRAERTLSKVYRKIGFVPRF